MLRQLLTRSAANGGSIALALLVFTLAPDSARADQKPGRAQPPANALEDEPAYQRAVEQGLHEYQLGNFSEAKAFFARAHELSPNARTLRGLGMSAYELRDYVEAIAYFEQALDATERPLTPPMREEVVRLLGQARSFITRLTLSLRPSTTEVRVDARPVHPDAAGVILLDPGEHELLFAAPNRDSVTRNLRTDGGETLSMNIALPTPEQAAAAATPLPVPLTAAAPAASSASPAPWFVIGSGAAVAIAGGVFLGVALSDKASVEHPETRDGGLPYYPNYSGAEKRVFPFSVIGITGLGLGVAGIIAGLVWKISASGARESAAQVETTPAGARFSARF
jgi:hypothetical protein